MSDQRTRHVVHLALLVVALVTAGLVAVGYSGSLRPVGALVTLALLPGAAVLSRLPALDLTSWFGQAIVLSLAVATIGALAMAWTGWWNPAVLAVVLGGASCVALAVDLRSLRPRVATP